MSPIQDSERQGVSLVDSTRLANLGRVFNPSSTTGGTAYPFATLEQSGSVAPLKQAPSPSDKLLLAVWTLC